MVVAVKQERCEDYIMTTRVTVDAHAGWPVEVTVEHGEPQQEKTIVVGTVAPFTAQDFYIHSGMRILGIRELPQEKAQTDG